MRIFLINQPSIVINQSQSRLLRRLAVVIVRVPVYAPALGAVDVGVGKT
jgi:hypothetical protein